MTSSVTFGVHFVIRNNKQLNGKSPVYARITVNGTRCELALKEYLSPGDWNAGKGMAASKNKALKQFNSYLEEVRGKLARHYRELQMKGERLTAAAVGLAYVDLMALQPANIISSVDGMKWIRTTCTKSDIGVNVPLLPPALAV